MGERLYPTELSEHGPWLLDSDALREFDELVAEAWERLENRRKQIVEKAFDAYLRELEEEESSLLEDFEDNEDWIRSRATPYWAHRSNRELRIHLADGSSFVCETFAVALKNRSLVDQVPVGFELDLESADIRCRVNLSRSRENLSVDITPQDEPEARELFVTLRQWVVEHRSNYWHQLWARVASFGAHWIAGFVVLFFAFLFTLQIYESSPAADQAKQRAWQMLDQGLTAASIPEAVEILLILETGYKSATVYHFPRWFIIFGTTSTLALIALSIRPKTVLGIGQGQQVISRWQVWLKFLTVTLPTLLVSNVLLPLLRRLIGLVS